MSVPVNVGVRVEHGENGGLVVMSAHCAKCGEDVMPRADGTCSWCGSLIVDESTLSAKTMLAELGERKNGRDEPVGLGEAAAVGKRAESGAALLLVGEPERAAASSSGQPARAATRRARIASRSTRKRQWRGRGGRSG